ncbi:aldehyde dehydrogenase family protein, partial [Bacillus tequilensis]|uniref:aldehyde dehydrogenase family protein n=1 Tax=Bacillus tequilensis TaxID=227866 RepID=UPI0028421B9D
EDKITNIIGSAFGSAGEHFKAGAVVTVEEGISDGFRAKLQERATDINICNGLDNGVLLGTMIREENKKR